MKSILTSLALGAISAIVATSSASAQEIPLGRKQAVAARVPAGRLHIDGRLDEIEWQLAEPVVDFTQKEPVEGAVPRERIEVRFLYDEAALFIGARMANRSASRIQAPMSRRDDGDQAEYLLIALDTYLDRRTAYDFGVTASGVRIDRYHSGDDENSYDAGFDPVWEAKTTTDADGWTAEFWLPFSQLHFSASDALVWGLDIKRSTPALDETDYWVPIARTERAWASRFGELRGLSYGGAPHRLEIVPYVAGSSRVNGSRNPANPFDSGGNLSGRGGADVRIGFGPNLTLDATANPDFGQVEADPAEVNLTAFETFFPEKRPLFLTSSDLISKQSNFFYSRRIGARPSGKASGDFIDYPDTTTIDGAAKLTGRLPSGLSVGALAAVTPEERARTSTAGALATVRVAPFTSYSAGRVQQEIGSGGSTVGVEVAQLHRSMSASDPLASLLVRNAFSVVVDSLVRFDDRQYQSNISFGVEHISGAAAAIDLRQRSNVRYFQRPDGPAGRYDPTRTSLGGTQTHASIDKIGGRHWLWGGGLAADSPELDTNDIGRLNDSSDIATNGYLSYRETQPGPVFRAYSVQVSTGRIYDYDRRLGARVSYSSYTNLTWRNFWSTSLSTTFNPRAIDQRLTRGGPSMGTPRNWSVDLSLGNSGSRQNRWNLEVFRFGSEDHYWRRGGNGTITMRPAPTWQFSLTPGYDHTIDTRQYVSTLGGGRAETYGNRYIFGAIDRTTLSMELRAAYTFRPDLNLDVYGEPFAASGRYSDYGELLAPRSRALIEYGRNGITADRQADGTTIVTGSGSAFTLPNGDFNVRSFRSNVVLKWEWRPGSLLYAVWQQNRASSTPDGSHVGLGGLFDTLSAPGDNVFAVKISYWLSPR